MRQKDNAFHSPITTLYSSHLLLSSTGNGGWALLVLNGTIAAAAGLNRLNNLVRLDVAIGNTTEDDVLTVKPRSDDSSDKELRAVARVC